MYSDLELLIRHRDEDSYAVDIRIPLAEIRELDPAPDRRTKVSPHGIALSEAVFTGKVKEQFQMLRAASERAGPQ